MTASKTRLPTRGVSPPCRKTPRVLLISISFLALFLLYLPPHYLTVTHVHRIRILRRLVHSYQRLLHVHPLIARAVTAGFIFLLADFLSQTLQTPHGTSFRNSFSFMRLMRYSGYGLLVMGPFLYVWYAMMSAYGPDDDFSGSLQKCLFEQVTLEPICIAMYIVYDGLLRRSGFAGMTSKFAKAFLPLWFKNAIFWLPANFANYYIGTPDLRVAFANLCSLFWNIYFSGKFNRVKTPFGKRGNTKDNKGDVLEAITVKV